MKLSAELTAFAARLGHSFARQELLRRALTHSSIASPGRPDNQRLEFLGDRVLGLVMAEALLAPGEADVDSEAVLRLAAQSGCTAYDCEFVALAQKLAVTLITMDRALLRAFPEMAQALVERKALNDLLSAAESHADMSVRPRGRARRRSDPDLN